MEQQQIKSASQRIKMIREAVGKTQSELAEILGVKQSFLSAVERGVRKAPASWEIVLKKEYGVSNVFFQFGSITKEDRWYHVPPSRTSSRTPKPEKTSVLADKTAKNAANGPILKSEERQNNLLKADAIRNTIEAAAVGGEAAQRWGARRITESKLYKRFPSAESEGLNACFAASYLGKDSDNFLKALNDATHTKIDKVLDQVIDGEINMEQAALEIELLTGPLNDLQAHFEGLENAIFNMVTAVVKVYPEAMAQVRGTALHHGLLEWEVNNETDLQISV